MMEISFAWTKKELLSNKKTVTRRRWKDKYARLFRKQNIVTAIDMDRRYGGKGIARILITDVYKERLRDMPVSDLKAEGGRWPTVEAFAENLGLTLNHSVWVIRFRLVCKWNVREIKKCCQQ